MVLKAHQCFDDCLTVILQHRGFSYLFFWLPVNSLEVHKKLSGDQTRMADLNWSKEYCVMYYIVLDSEVEDTDFPKIVLALRLAENVLLLGVGEWLPLHHMLFFTSPSFSYETVCILTQVFTLGFTILVWVWNDWSSVFVLSCWPTPLYRPILADQ